MTLPPATGNRQPETGNQLPTRYRPDIDGLRAVAILAVVLYHSGFGCPGGYVGVDVFFVISGFLITSLIWRDLEGGSFTFAGFWERRARRIAPALVVVTLATLAVGWFLLMPVDLKTLGDASASQSLFCANIYHWLDTSYFSGNAAEKPLLHTWSLAVEEQFYLVVPFLLWGLYRAPSLRGRKAILSLLAAGFGVSFALSLYVVSHHPRAAFYLLPTRAWELLLGAIAAFLPQPPVLDRRFLRDLCALAGAVLILVPVCVYTLRTPFPGIAALPPCLGAALLLCANVPIERSKPTAIGAMLSTRPVVFIGLISYSLYLWHWPILAYGNYVALTPLSAGQRAFLLAFLGLAAVLSWKYVEAPFRSRKIGASRKSMLAFAGVGLGAMFLCGLLCRVTNGFPERISPQARIFAGAKLDSPYFISLTAEDIYAGKLIPIGVMDSALRPTVLVWGDSHAMSALTAIDDFLKERGLAGRAATHQATAPNLDWYKQGEFSADRHAYAYNAAVLSYIRREHIPHVILIAHWVRYMDFKENAGLPAADFTAKLLATVRQIDAAGSRPWVMLDVPNQSIDVPKALSRPYYSRAAVDTLRARPLPWNELSKRDPRIVDEIKATGGRVLDPKPRFLDPKSGQYIIEANGFALYSDKHHLTTYGSKLMLLPFFRESWTLK